jgi:hypothetical protein
VTERSMEYMNIAYCGACGAALPERSDRGNLIEHIKACEKHPLHEALGEADRFRSEVDRLTRERDAIVKRCYQRHVSSAGNPWWELLIDPIVECDTDYDTEAEAVSGVYKAAGLDATAPEGVPGA